MSRPIVNIANGRYANSVPVRLVRAIEQAGATGLTVEAFRTLIGEGRLETARDTLARMVAAGRLFAAGAHKNRRWFATAADAHEWDTKGRPPTQRERREAARLASEAQKEAKRAARLAQLAAPRTRYVWTDAQLAILRAEYPTKGVRLTAEKTGQPEGAVRSKANRLGLKCTQRPPYRQREGVITKREERLARQALRRAEQLAVQAVVAVAPTVTIARRGPFDPSIPVAYHPDFKFTRAAPPPAPLRSNTHSTY